MEQRKITVTSTKDASGRKTIMSSATTLGELKADLRANNIDVENMTFYEAISRTDLVQDEAVLPHDLPYTNKRTGESKITNELIFVMSYNKKISSGADRNLLYVYIKDNNLQEQIKKTFGIPFTNISSKDLETFIDENKKQSKDKNEEVHKETTEEIIARLENKLNSLLSIVDDLLDVLEDNGSISFSEYETLIADVYKLFDDISKETKKEKDSIESPYSNEELNDILDSINY